jgi:hypothetical protein
MVSELLGELASRGIVDIAGNCPLPTGFHRRRMSGDFPVLLAGIRRAEVMQAATGILLDDFPN